MSRQTRMMTYVGIALAGVGFGLIALAWDGAASYDYVPAQLPYLISGGLTGIGLIVVGVTVIAVQRMRQEGAERAAELDQLLASIATLERLLAAPDEDDTAVTGEYRPRPRTPAAGPGPAPARDPVAAPPPRRHAV